MKKPLKIAISNDHAGTDLKISILDYLQNHNYKVINLGTDKNEAVDYPDYAFKAAKLLKEKKIDYGVLICGSGIGISIAANRFSHIRAALCNDVLSCELARLHNDANILVLGARLISKNLAIECINKFLSTNFEGGRHKNRVKKLSNPPIL